MIAAALAAAAWLTAAADEQPQPQDKPAPSPFMQTVKPRKLGCPLGTHSVDDAVGARCVMDGPDAAPAAPAAGLAGWDYAVVRTPDLQVELPSAWHRTQAWDDEVPTLSAERDASGEGRPVTLMVCLLSPGQPDFQTLADAIRAEKQDRGAREQPRRRVAGRSARETLVPGESRSVYVDAGGGAYFLFVYSASGADFKAYQAAFSHLVSSARFLK